MKHCMTCKDTNEKVLSINTSKTRKSGQVYRTYICRDCRRERWHRQHPEKEYRFNYKPRDFVYTPARIKPDIPVEAYYEKPKQEDLKFSDILANANTINQNIMLKYARR